MLHKGWSWTYGYTKTGGNILSHNNISAIGMGVLCDMACVYHLGQDNGTMITNNLCTNVSSYGYGGNGYYTDAGSSNVTISLNIAHDIKCAGFFENFGMNNNISNNVFGFVSLNEFTSGADHAGANCLDQSNQSSTAFRVAAVASGENAPGSFNGGRFFFNRNIIYNSYPNFGNGTWGPNWGAPLKVKALPHIKYEGVMILGTTGLWASEFSSNMYWTNGMGLQPPASVLHSRGFMCNNSNPPGQNWPGCSFQSWQKSGFDVHGAIADPLFVNPTGRDFRLRPGSPALAMGIVSIVPSYGPRLQKTDDCGIHN